MLKIKNMMTKNTLIIKHAYCENTRIQISAYIFLKFVLFQSYNTSFYLLKLYIEIL